MGELTVDFSVYGWFPEILPSEETGSGGEEEVNDEQLERAG